MIALLQRVSRAKVVVDGACVAAIQLGLLALVGVQRGDGEGEADRLLERVLGYRMFADGQGRMNLSVSKLNGDLLLVPQFTLPADTRSGLRPSFSSAAHPDISRSLFDYFVDRAKLHHGTVRTGVFGERMEVELVNDGPVTFWLEVTPSAQSAARGPGAGDSAAGGVRR